MSTFTIDVNLLLFSCKANLLTFYCPTEGRRMVGCITRWFTSQTVAHPFFNYGWHRATEVIETMLTDG